MSSRYEQDIVNWAYEQARLIRAKRFDLLDLEHIAEEIEDVGKSEQRELASRMTGLLAHLLKWQYQPERQGSSWRLTIRNQRNAIARALDDTPSLKTKLAESRWWQAVWEDAQSKAAEETGLGDEFPSACPWSQDEILGDWWPQSKVGVKLEPHGADKMTNRLNVMGNVSADWLIEMIMMVSLPDDAGASGEMWNGRAISFVAALTRPLIFLRDQGHLNLSPEVFIDHFDLDKLISLVYDSGQKYGPSFELVIAPLKSYLETLPGFKTAPEQRKKQDPKTIDQHRFIVMQLTSFGRATTQN